MNALLKRATSAAGNIVLGLLLVSGEVVLEGIAGLSVPNVVPLIGAGAITVGAVRTLLKK